MKTKTRKGKTPSPERISLRPSPGAAPGTLVRDPNAPRSVVQLIAYGPDGIQEFTPGTLDAVPAALEKWPVVWINVDGLGDPETINKLGELFNLHPLAMADVVNVNQRPKIDSYDDHVYIVSKMISRNEQVEFEQISLFLGKKYLLTFQEKQGDCFEPVRERLRNGKGKIRKAGPDYLAYALLDAVIDFYFPILETYDDYLEEIEEHILVNPTDSVVRKTHQIRRDLIHIRRAIWPQREAINSLIRDDHALIRKTTIPFLRDCQDHIIQIIDLVESYREVNSSLTEVYLSNVSNRMNEVMKVLTVIATIFIPLTFIAGIYGMNFKYMPELELKYGYAYCLAFMALVTGGLVLFFLKKGWLK